MRVKGKLIRPSLVRRPGQSINGAGTAASPVPPPTGRQHAGAAQSPAWSKRNIPSKSLNGLTREPLGIGDRRQHQIQRQGGGVTSLETALAQQALVHPTGLRRDLSEPFRAPASPLLTHSLSSGERAGVRANLLLYLPARFPPVSVPASGPESCALTIR